MGKIVFIMGKSSVGKDTIFSQLRERFPELQVITTCTTRPIREGEQQGREYHFVSREEFEALKAGGKVIESRSYPTVHGDWIYFTASEGVDPAHRDYLVIGTPEAYESYAAYFGKDKLLPVMVELEDGERLSRAVRREKKQKTPSFSEVCRRFLADQEDFSEEKIVRAGIPWEARFENLDLERCLEEIASYIKYHLA